MSLAASALADARPQARGIDYALAPHALALAIFAICAFSPSIFNDADTFSHIATGEWMLSHHAIPRADPFTFSVAGKPWTAHEWLSEILLALAHRAGGLPGVALLTGAAAAAGLFVILRAAGRELGGAALAVIGVLALMLIAPGLLARPHILALPVLALWAEALSAARERAPPLGFALLMTLWANLHGGFAFGLALIAPFALEAVVDAPAERRAARARDWGVFGLAATAAALINPFGVGGLLFPVRLLGLRALAQVGEWGPETFAKPNALEAAMLGLLALALTRPVRLPPLRLATLIGLFYLSLTHARHEMLLAVVAPMLLARPLAEGLATPPEAPRRSPRLALAGLVAATLLFACIRAFLPAPAPAAYELTRRALAAAPADLRRQPLHNGYGFGGYLIFEGVKPYVDARADLFGDEFLQDYNRIARGDRNELIAALGKYDIGWTMFPSDGGAVATMDSLPGWRRIYTAPGVVVHARAP
jgi:hypothetical protein